MTSALAKKLLAKPGHRVLLLNAPPGARELLEPLPDGAACDTSPDGVYDLVLWYAAGRTELERLAASALAARKPDGLFWVAFPKGSSRAQTDLTRDRGWDVLNAAGLRGVTLVSVDDRWSAFRLR